MVFMIYQHVHWYLQIYQPTLICVFLFTYKIKTKKTPQNCELCRNVCTYCIRFWIYFIDVENLVIVKNYYYYQWTLNILGKWQTGNTFQFKRNVLESVKIVVDAHQKNSITHLNFNYLRALHSTVHLS